MNAEWSFRVTPDDWNEMEARFTFIRMQCSPKALLIVKEVGSAMEKPHMHGYIEAPGVTQARILYMLKKAFKVNGPGQLQCKNPAGAKGFGTVHKCLCYISKGVNKETPPEVLYRQGIPEEDIAKYHDEYWSVNARIVERTGVPAVKKPTLYASLKDLCSHCENGNEVADVCADWYGTVDRHVSWHCFKDVVRKLSAEHDGLCLSNVRQQLREVCNWA